MRQEIYQEATKVIFSSIELQRFMLDRKRNSEKLYAKVKQWTRSYLNQREITIYTNILGHRYGGTSDSCEGWFVFNLKFSHDEIHCFIG